MPKAPRLEPRSPKGKTVMSNNLYPQDTGETPGHATPRADAHPSGVILGVDSALEYVGPIGVDSGQVILMDPRYLLGGDTTLLYDTCAEGHIRHQGPHQLGVGGTDDPKRIPLAITCSGFGGDGYFPAYITRDDDGMVASLQVHFTRDPKAHGNLTTVIGAANSVVNESAITDAALLESLVDDYRTTMESWVTDAAMVDDLAADYRASLSADPTFLADYRASLDNTDVGGS